MSRLRGRPAERGRLVKRVAGEEKFPQVIEFMARELADGREAYVVVPLIEVNGRPDSRAAEAERERLTGHPPLAWSAGGCCTAGESPGQAGGDGGVLGRRGNFWLRCEPSWIEFRRNDEVFLRFIEEVGEVLGGPGPPRSARCAFCS